MRLGAQGAGPGLATPLPAAIANKRRQANPRETPVSRTASPDVAEPALDVEYP
jgi:hypothetical protein